MSCFVRRNHLNSEVTYWSNWWTRFHLSCPDNLLKVSLLICFGEIAFFFKFFGVFFYAFSFSLLFLCVSSFIYTVEQAGFLQAQVASAMLGHAKGGELHEIYLG